MGVLNITPDSFSDGGVFLSAQSALARARQMVEEGAAIIDVGGESTRPGATPVSVQEELDRVIPIVEAISRDLPVIISIDTSKPEVMRAAVGAGAGIINDVRALREPGALDAATQAGVPVCLMHMEGEPRTMQQNPSYGDVVAEVKGFLLERVEACVSAGMFRDRLLIDPGFGFGKTLADNLRLARHLDELATLGPALVVGVSRKSMIGAVLDRPLDQRLPGGLAFAALAVWQGAKIIRTHDVQATADAVNMVWAIAEA
ncbi:MAG: dihydropteroate synthase [Gammaproteobacteria bacterium]|nr:dihydropteroate synthase [Gammaproteobacteria bacterium]